jgi:hypothetical protein
MSRTLCCPGCGSNQVRRHEQIWLQGQSMVRGPRYTTTRISDLAQRHAPPSLPRTSGYWYARLAWHAGLALVPLGIAMFCLATRAPEPGLGSDAQPGTQQSHGAIPPSMGLSVLRQLVPSQLIDRCQSSPSHENEP